MSSAQRSPTLKWHGDPQCVPECSPIVVLLSLKPSFSTVKSVSSSNSESPGKIGIPTVFTWLRKTTLLNPNGPVGRCGRLPIASPRRRVYQRASSGSTLRPRRVPYSLDRPAALAVSGRARRKPSYLSGFVPAIQMMTRENLPSASTSKKLQLCMSFFVPSTSSPM